MGEQDWASADVYWEYDTPVSQEGRSSMRLKALLLTLFVAGLTASIAIAAPPPGKGKPTSSSSVSSTTTTTAKGKSAAKKPACTPRKQVNLVGTLAADPAADGTFGLAVTSGNANGKKLAGTQLTVDASHAKVVKQGKKTVAALKSGDRVQVKAKTCTAVGATAPFVATQVVVLGAKSTSTTSTVASSTTTS